MSGLKINIFVAILVPWAACSLAMIGRIAARRMTKVTWWYEDYFCVAAYVSIYFESIYYPFVLSRLSLC